MRYYVEIPGVDPANGKKRASECPTMALALEAAFTALAGDRFGDSVAVIVQHSGEYAKIAPVAVYRLNRHRV